MIKLDISTSFINFGTVKKSPSCLFSRIRTHDTSENKKLLKSYEIRHQTFNGLWRLILIDNFVQALHKK